MSQALVLDTQASPVIRITSRLIGEQEYRVRTWPPQQTNARTLVGSGSLLAAILSTLLLRIAGRTSFVLLGFYLGERFTSATIVAVVLEAFYLSELALSPLVGSLSDRMGHKPFLLAAPLVAGGAALCLLAATQFFPHPEMATFDVRLVVLLLIVLVGRLLEGAATALNTPASLGYITEATANSERLRARVMTAFEIATVAGLALAMPFGGKVSSVLGTWGFGVVLVLHLINGTLIARCLKERRGWTKRQSQAHYSLVTSLSAIRYKRVYTFLPAWLSINALVGAWLTLCTIMLTYPEPAARLRHPGQMLYGGFSQVFATMLLGGFGLLFLAGMGLWLLVLPHVRRTTVMLVALGGLSSSIVGLTAINGLGHALAGSQALLALLLMVVLGVLLLSGFTPASLNHLAAIAELLPGKRGAVMGLYSVVMGVGQLVGALLGGLCVDAWGFYGLMIFSVAMGLVSLGSVLYMRTNGQDLLCSSSPNPPIVNTWRERQLPKSPAA